MASGTPAALTHLETTLVSKKDEGIVEMMELPGGMLVLLISPRLANPFWRVKKLSRRRRRRRRRTRTRGGGASLARPWRRERLTIADAQHVIDVVVIEDWCSGVW